MATRGKAESPARAFPAKSVASVVTVAVKVVSAASSLVGVNTPVLLPTEYVTLPPTGVRPGPVTVKLVEVRVAGAISSEKVAVTDVLVATSRVGPGLVVKGSVRVTVGLVRSEVPPVVKCQMYGATKVRPVLRLLTPVTVAV